MTENLSTHTGEFALIPNTRRLRGLVTPYGETGVNEKGEYEFAAGSVSLPDDALDLWIGHDHKQHLGRTVSLEETDRGIEAEFEIDEGLVGDRFLAEYAQGKKHNLSAEFAQIVRDGARVVSSVLTGVAAVVLGGFASAAFFEVAAPEAPALTPEQIASLRALLDTLPQTPEAEADSAADDAEETETPTPNQEPDAPAITESEDAMAEAVAPNTVTAPAVEKEEVTLSNVFNLMTRAGKGDEAAEFALSDIKISGSGALPAAGVIQPAWLGEIWQGRAYTRKYLPLVRNGVIRSLDEKGFVIDQGTALVARWTGNKTELPSGTASTSVKASTLYKYGAAFDVAREFYDLPGGEEVLAAFFRGVVNSYARVTDLDALAEIVTAAGAPVAPETYPTDYPASMGMLIQGIEAVEDAGDTPSFAIANELAWKELLYTPRDQVPEFVSFAFGTNFNGSADGGKLRVVKGDIGIDDTAAVLVGSANAMHFNEKAGESPVQLDALDIAKGGVDRAFVGYLQFLADYPDALVLVGEADV